MTPAFWGSLAGACLMGMSCGTGCSPAISIFLSSYVFHAEGNTRESLLAFLRFFIGKAVAILMVCAAASLLRIALVEQGGYFGRYKLSLLMPVFLILTGIYMLRRCIREMKGGGCDHCHGACRYGTKSQFTAAGPAIGGFLYGLTPCVPMVLLTGYAVTLPLPLSLLLGAAFSAACMISPLFLMMIFLKLVAFRMYREVPRFFTTTKAILSAGVLILGIVTCFTGIEPGVV